MSDEIQHEPLSTIPPIEIPDPDVAVVAATRGFTPQALRLLLSCSRHLALGLAHVLSRWWQEDDPVRAGIAEHMLVRVELEKQRAVVELTYYFGYSYDEISEIVGCPANTVKTRMFHARTKLKELLPRLGHEVQD